MNLFKSNNKFKSVGAISVFPTIKTIVLKKDTKLIILNPEYLLGKHSKNSNEVASKFLNLETAKQLLELVDDQVSSKILKGPKVEIPNINYGVEVGTNNLVKISEDLVEVLPTENIRGHKINVIYTKKEKIPKTNLLNIVLIRFNPAYGQGVDSLFNEKYAGVSFDDFDEVYAIVTIYPGKFAPPMDDKTFWNYHALLKQI